MTVETLPLSAIFAGGSFMLTLLGLAMAYGKLTKAVEQSSKAVDTIRSEGEVARNALEAQIKEARRIGEQARDDMSSHRLHASETFVRKTDLGAMEDRIGARLDDLKSDFSGKVDEIKADFGKRSIEHAIKNAIASALAPEQIAQVRARRS